VTAQGASAAPRGTVWSCIGRAFRAIEPGYNWGSSFSENMDGTAEGPCRFFELEWLGISFTIFFGRTPRKGEG
jgi:hypothetical protein